MTDARIHPQIPNTTQELQARIYRGDIFKCSPTPATQALVDDVNLLLQQEFRTDALNDVHNLLSEDAFFLAMKAIRKHLFEEARYHQHVKNVLQELGYNEGECKFEPLRLRAIRHNGHENPRAKAVYYPHRDTWYGHGQSLIVGWIPLHDQTPDQTFEIYPDYLENPVPNNSEVFNFETWRDASKEKQIGWQHKNTGLTAVYPEATATVKINDTLQFSANTAENLLFSGAHFHKTREQTNNKTRFSVDYRFVYLADHHAKKGAFNADNRSKGDAVTGYLNA